MINKDDTKEKKVTIHAVIAVFLLAAAIVAWFRFGSALFLILLSLPPLIFLFLDERAYFFGTLIHFGIWCIFGSFLDIPFYIFALLAVDIPLALIYFVYFLLSIISRLIFTDV